MSLLQQIGQSVGSFLASKRGVANGFAGTDANNHLLASHLPTQVVIRDASGKISPSDLPASLGVGMMHFSDDFDASAGVAPVSPSADNLGWVWRVTVPGTVLGVRYEIGDWLVSTGTGFVCHANGASDLGTTADFTAALNAAFLGTL